ncbi:MAG: peptidylprolyl isomerase [Burkholderiales bacterium]
MNTTLARIALAGALLVSGESTRAAALPADTFARVGNETISMADYEMAFRTAARSKFYHGNAPEAEIAKLQREVGDRVVNDVLLAKEAARRGIKPDTAAVARQLDALTARYKGSENWKQTSATVLPALEKRLKQESALEQLEKQVRAVPAPTDRQIEAYYSAHQDKFTEPEQVRLSVILLKVDPSSPKAAWEGAKNEGASIVKRIRSGAAFDKLAELHSQDASASKGGAMGYVHQGMLPEPAQLAVDKLKAGEVADPVVLLEGVAIFRLEDRRPAKLNALSAVKERAAALWQREQSDLAWSALVAKIRSQASVTINESHYRPLANASAAK